MESDLKRDSLYSEHIRQTSTWIELTLLFQIINPIRWFNIGHAGNSHHLLKEEF